jgi:hypothetical protein
VKLAVFVIFFKRIAVRVFTAAAALQTFSWLYGWDEVVRAWLLDHNVFTTICLIGYIIWDYLLYGGRDAEYFIELRNKTERRKK